MNLSMCSFGRLCYSVHSNRWLNGKFLKKYIISDLQGISEKIAIISSSQTWLVLVQIISNLNSMYKIKLKKSIFNFRFIFET